jgi:four helix bundle protein
MKKNSKSQTPNSREPPKPKLQKAKGADVPPEETSPDLPGEVWVLNEGATGSRHPFDLEERTARFGEAVVCFSKKIPREPGNNRLIDQIVGAGTSVGANYCEAEERVSSKDFKNIIGRCTKEAKETMFFLRMIAAAEPDLADEARKLYREAKELMLIFAAIYRK